MRAPITEGEEMLNRTAFNPEKGEVLQELDAALRHRYHQGLDEVLHDMYIHDVISRMDLSSTEIIRLFESVPSLKDATATIIQKFHRVRN